SNQDATANPCDAWKLPAFDHRVDRLPRRAQEGGGLVDCCEGREILALGDHIHFSRARYRLWTEHQSPLFLKCGNATDQRLSSAVVLEADKVRRCPDSRLVPMTVSALVAGRNR